MRIAIDGPSGAGKSTIAKALAQQLGIIYIDTGAMYRAIGLKAARLGLLDSDSKIAEMASQTQIDIRFSPDGTQLVLLDGEDVSGLIRTPAMSMNASRVSALPAVRERLVALQREIAGEKSVVMDGRDIATHVLPNAEYKFFLTASAEERARRRCAELADKGQAVSYQEVLADVVRRDLQDTTRAASPLRQHPDAILIDSTTLSFPQVLDVMLQNIRRNQPV